MELPCQGVTNRKAFPCPATSDWDVSELIKECSDCERYYMYCCQHSKEKGPCHHFPLYFTDGACANNGQKDAKAGVGIARGILEDDRFSIPVTDDVDSFPLRSNQRAELLAACLALSKIHGEPAFEDEPRFAKRHKRNFSEASNEPRSAIIATDSQYVVKGITEWLPTWKGSFE
jgi:ribonuclease HI